MTFLFLPDVNFIASPPSMVAAGSVVAAVQGLYLKSIDASFSSQNLTNMLSQVIGSDPVCRHILIQPKNLTHWFVMRVHRMCVCVWQDCLRACQEQIESLLESSLQQAQHHSSSSSSSAEPKCASADADLSCTPTDVRDVNIWNSWELRWVTDLQLRGVKVFSGVRAGTAASPPPPLIQRLLMEARHTLQDGPREKQGQLKTRVGSSWRYNICLYILLL